MSINNLPPEVLAQILLNLGPRDRLKTAATNRRFAEAVSEFRMLQDVSLECPDLAIDALMGSQRRYSSSRVFHVTLKEYNSRVWRKLGVSLRDLRIVDCRIPAEVLYNVLRDCPMLEVLAVGTSLRRDFGYDDMLRLPEGIRREEVQQSLRHVRHLSLMMSVTAEIFNDFLRLMPSITSLFLKKQHSMSTEELLSTLTNLDYKLEKLEMLYNNRAVKGLIDQYSNSLRELTLTSDPLGFRRSPKKIGDCTKLRRLTLHNEHRFDLERVCLNAPDLEHLDIRDCYLRETDCLRNINNLRRLRHFVAPYRMKLDEDIMTKLATIATLRHLDFLNEKIDERGLCQLVHLRNLRSLTFSGSNLTAECFAMICDNLDRLRRLEIRSVSQLTDEAGEHLHRLKKLRFLVLRGARQLTDSFFIEGVGSRAMEHLDIETCLLTDATLMSIGSNHPHLRNLTLSGLLKFTDNGLAAFLHRRTQLQNSIWATVLG